MTRGTIVLDYNSKGCEVEFFNDERDTLDVLKIPKEKFNLLWEYSMDSEKKAIQKSN